MGVSQHKCSNIGNIGLNENPVKEDHYHPLSLFLKEDFCSRAQQGTAGHSPFFMLEMEKRAQLTRAGHLQGIRCLAPHSLGGPGPAPRTLKAVSLNPPRNGRRLGDFGEGFKD